MPELLHEAGNLVATTSEQTASIMYISAGWETRSQQAANRSFRPHSPGMGMVSFEANPFLAQEFASVAAQEQHLGREK